MPQETPISNPLSEAPQAPAVILAPPVTASTRRPFVKPQLVKHGSVAAITNDFGGSANPG
ncbi:MAG: lasso RiPP family leader peptide-containing protein [Candidatus Competibacter sp.]|nr:lasso RiPP family leader peptide-containing protein [Candidatus Competibacter sp.]